MSRCTRFIVFVVLVWMERRFRLVKGQVCAAYVGLYTAGRFVFENMRIDLAHTIGPLRLNAWVSLFVFATGWSWFLYLGRRGRAGLAMRSAECDRPHRSAI